jgi:hypothetical protein
MDSHRRALVAIAGTVRVVLDPIVNRVLLRPASARAVEVAREPGIVALADVRAELLHEHGHARGLALFDEAPRPRRPQRPRPWAALAADDHPIKRGWFHAIPSQVCRQSIFSATVGGELAVPLLEIRELDPRGDVDLSQQRLRTDEPHRRRRLQQQRDPLVGKVLVLDADAQPHVRQWRRAQPAPLVPPSTSSIRAGRLVRI